ncbi:MAG: 4Fe-4S binding protein [Halobacteriovoraceae bacterium]|jgi:formate hydrogenlyase subunit 6/NADH:ubiquinone oxidoreductase subunit I|nr:4Fe-4S binding protein [Halobacteriovoraceae bacterium]
MLINFQRKNSTRIFKKITQTMNLFIIDLNCHFIFRRLFNDSLKLKKYFKTGHPAFKFDTVGNTKCISCRLCEEICPTNSIDLVKANMVNFPDSLTTGEAPLHFYLDILKCTKCGECQRVCYVDALEVDQSYSGTTRIDLVR